MFVLNSSVNRTLVFGIIEGILKSPNFEGEKCRTVEVFEISFEIRKRKF